MVHLSVFTGTFNIISITIHPETLSVEMTDNADRRQSAKQYWPIRRASNKLTLSAKFIILYISGITEKVTVHNSKQSIIVI